MRLQEIYNSSDTYFLREARKQRVAANQNLIKMLGAHISDLRKGNEKLNTKMYLMNELLKILLSASLNQEYIDQELRKKGVKI